MDYGSCIIIHQSSVVQNGLNSIVQSLKVETREILWDCPDCKVMMEWRSLIVFIDIKHQDFIRKHRKYLQKHNNSIIGLDFAETPLSDLSPFDEVIFKTDNQNNIIYKIRSFTNNKGDKSSSNQLSVREREILRFVAQGKSNKQIAENLFISIHTVITHRKHITAKLGVKSISGLTLYASINNLID